MKMIAVALVVRVERQAVGEPVDIEHDLGRRGVLSIPDGEQPCRARPRS